MTKKTEALKLAFKQAFDLGQTYWSWADSEYQSHWKKADAAKERFNQLVEDAIREILAEQQTDWEAVAADQAMTIGLLKAVQPAQQEPVAWRSFGKLFSGLECWRFATHRSTFHDDPEQEPLYTTPPAQRTWIGLTTAGRKEIERQSVYVEGAIRLTEAKLKEKNT